jgi:hypothetical protein
MFALVNEQGTRFHAFIEAHLTKRPRIETHFEKHTSAIKRLQSEVIEPLGLQLYKTEWTRSGAISEQLYLRGRIDAVFLRPCPADLSRAELFLFDWKFSSTPLLFGKQGRQLLPEPLQPLSDDIANKYALQLGLYNEILRRQGFSVCSMIVCRFDPLLPDFYELAMVESPILDQSIKFILETASKK